MQKIRQKHYDAIVSDYQLPIATGLDFLKELRDNGNRIPFILFTGKGREEIAIEALNLGADRYLNKIGHPGAVYGELAHAIEKTVEGFKAEKRIIESEAKFRYLFETAPDTILTANMNGVITSCNAAALKLTGYSKEELIGKHYVKLNFFRARDLPKYMKLMSAIVRNKTVEPFEVAWHTKDGTEIISEVHLNILTDGNKPIGVQAVCRDVTERRKAEKEIQELAKFPSEDPNPVLRIDKNGQVLYANKVALEHHCEEVPEKLQKAVANSLRSGLNEELETDCGNQTFSFIVTLIPDEGYANVYGQNVTEANTAWKSLDESITALVQINEKLDVVSRLTRHDVRNKLSIILNNIYLAKQKLEGNQTALDQLQKVESAINQVEQIFDFAAAYNLLGVEELTHLNV